MTDFSDLCQTLQLENLATIKMTTGNQPMLVKSLEDSVLRSPKTVGKDWLMFFDICDPSTSERAHCRLFLPNGDSDLKVLKGDILLIRVYVSFLN